MTSFQIISYSFKKKQNAPNLFSILHYYHLPQQQSFFKNDYMNLLFGIQHFSGFKYTYSFKIAK